MTLIKGQFYLVKWVDAAEDPDWVSERDIDDYAKENEQGVVQILCFVKESESYYIFTTGIALGNRDYPHGFLIPKLWITQLEPVEIRLNNKVLKRFFREKKV